MDHTLLIAPDGTLHGVYTDIIDLRTIGPLTVQRASVVTFDHETQGWISTLLQDGTRLGPFQTRREAVIAEHNVLTERLIAQLTLHPQEAHTAGERHPAPASASDT